MDKKNLIIKLFKSLRGELLKKKLKHKANTQSINNFYNHLEFLFFSLWWVHRMETFDKTLKGKQFSAPAFSKFAKLYLFDNSTISRFFQLLLKNLLYLDGH